MESQLDRKVREYQRLLDRKAELEMQTKENNAAKEALEQEICRMMVDEEKPNTIVDGFSYSLSQKIMYSKKSEEDLAKLQKETGISFFDLLLSMVLEAASRLSPYIPLFPQLHWYIYPNQDNHTGYRASMLHHQISNSLQY